MKMRTCNTSAKKKWLTAMLLLMFVYGNAQTDSSLYLSKQDMQWWKDAKFGLFIHWGLYSIPGKGEWTMFVDKWNGQEYAKLSNEFTGTKFNADEWAAIAKKAGCRYMVLTAKHHDGFSLYNTSFNQYNSVATAAKKDFIKEYTIACRNAGLGVGIYYSPLDWRYPGFFFPDMYRESAEEMKQQTYTQVKELLSNYGKVDILWYDGGEDFWLGLGGLEFSFEKWWHQRPAAQPYTGTFSWEPLKLNKMVRELQPKIVINPRSGFEGDFDTEERKFNDKRKQRPWEHCTTLTYSAWGWMPNTVVMSLDSCIDLFVKTISAGGNLLLNVGPDKDGQIEPMQTNRLLEIGNWLNGYGEAVYGSEAGPYPYNAAWGGLY
ncbi:MAG: alpha-L-fucosidase [Bacteroidia bacterium]|nr:alpha-L-fucosidase [Bacteroidia bacterium]